MFSQYVSMGVAIDEAKVRAASARTLIDGVTSSQPRPYLTTRKPVNDPKTRTRTLNCARSSFYRLDVFSEGIANTDISDSRRFRRSSKRSSRPTRR